MTITSKATETRETLTSARRPKAQGAHSRSGGTDAPPKRKSGKKTSRKNKRLTSRQGEHASTGPRDGSKTAQALELLRRPNGVTLKELMSATHWQAHSIRGFLSGAVRKKMGLAVTSTKDQDGDRTYF